MAQLVSLEINRNNFKLCCIDEIKGAKQVQNLVRIDFDPESPEKTIGELVRKTLNDLKIRSDRIHCVLPRHNTTVRIIKLPSVKREELDGMIDIQTARMIPYPKEEIRYSYSVIAEEKKEYSWARVVIAHRNIVNRVINIAKAAGVSAESLVLSTDTSLNWFINSRGIGDETFVLANIDESFLDVSIVYRGLVIFSRSVAFAKGQFDNNNIATEIKKTVLGFRKEELFLLYTDKLKINEIFLMGIKVTCGLVSKEMSSELPLKVSILADEGIKEATDNIKDKYAKISFCNCLGLLLSERKMIDFIPQDLKQKVVSGENQKHFIIIGSLIVALLLAAGSVIYKKNLNNSRVLSFLEEQIDENEKMSKDIKIAKSRLEAIKEWNEGKKLSVDVLKELYRITPEEISLTVLNYDVSTPLILQGSAHRMSEIFKYVRILEQFTTRLFRN